MKNLLSRHRKTIVFSFVLSVIVCVAYTHYSKNFQSFRTLKTVRHDGINFDSRSSNSTLSAVQAFSENDTAPVKALNTSWRMKIYSIQNWNNVFQTSDGNDGVRMEMAKPSTLGLLIGHTTAKKTGDERVYTLLETLQTNRWYAFHLTIDRQSRIIVQVDGQQVLNAEMDTTDSSAVVYDISRIAVGTGFSSTRPFDGVLEDFSMDYTFLEPNKTFDGFISATRYLLMFICFGLLSFLLVPYRFEGVKALRQISNARLTRVGKIRYVVFVMTIGFIVAVFFHYVKAMFWREIYPLNTFLPAPETRYGDLYGPLYEWKRSSFNGIGYGLSYFPSTYLIVNLLAMLGRYYVSLVACLTLFTSFVFVYVYQNIRTEDRLVTLQNTVVCAFTSYPFLMTYHTANLEMFVFIFLCLFIYFYQKNRMILSSFCLAMSLSMKLFPIVFLVLYISDKRYKEVLYTLVWAFALTLTPLLIFKGGIQHGLFPYLSNLRASQNMYKELMIMGISGLHYGHSFLCAVRIMAGSHFPPMQAVLFPYLLLTMNIFIVLSLYIIYFETEFWKKVALLVLAMNLLPYTSTDYKLMHFFIPLFLFVNAAHGDKLDVVYAVLFSLLLIPKDFCYFHNWPLFSLNNVANPLIMSVLVLLIVYPRLRTLARNSSSLISRRPSDSISTSEHIYRG